MAWCRLGPLPNWGLNTGMYIPVKTPRAPGPQLSAHPMTAAGAGTAAGGGAGGGLGAMMPVEALRWSQCSCSNIFTSPKGVAVNPSFSLVWSKNKKFLEMSFPAMAGLKLWDLYSSVVQFLETESNHRIATKSMTEVHLTFQSPLAGRTCMSPLAGRTCMFPDSTSPDEQHFVVMDGNRRLTLARLVCAAVVWVTQRSVPVLTETPGLCEVRRGALA